jgi:hypothetical protein
VAKVHRITATLFLLFTVSGFAQELPEPPRHQETQQRFLDRETTIELAGSAAALSVDALSTMKVMAYQNVGFHERNPLVRPFANTRATTAAYFASAFGLEVGGMYLVHRNHWTKAKRLIPVAVIGAEAFVSWGNYHWVSHQSHSNNCFIHGFNQGICP